MTTDRDAVERMAPERIWLQHDPENIAPGEFPSPDHWEHITWAGEVINETDVEYIRADHADAKLQAAVAEMREALNTIARHDVPPAEPFNGRLCSHGRNVDEDCNTCTAAFARAALSQPAAPQPAPTDALERAIEAAVLAEREACLQAIADLPTGRAEEVMEGQEQAYRAIEARARAAQSEGEA